MSKRSPILPLLIVAALGGSYVASSASCGGATGQHAATASDAFIDCDTTDVPSTIFGDLITLAKQALRRLISGVGTVDPASVEADLRPIVSDAGRCAAAVAVAQINEIAPTSTTTGSGSAASSAPASSALAQPMAAATTPDATQISNTFSQVRSKLGWPKMRTHGREY